MIMKMEIEMRYKILKAMDQTVRECVNDESYMESWLMIGIPDDSTDADFWDYAEDEDDFNEFVETYSRLIDRLDADPDEMSKEDIANIFAQNIR
jgi:hypothetical protein